MNFTEKAETHCSRQHLEREIIPRQRKSETKAGYAHIALRCFDKWKEYVDKGKTQDKDKKCAH